MITIDTRERWRPIDGYAGLYEVSNKGRVRNRHGVVLRPSVARLGKEYPQVKLCREGYGRTFTIARLVREAFPEATP